MSTTDILSAQTDDHSRFSCGECGWKLFMVITEAIDLANPQPARLVCSSCGTDNGGIRWEKQA